MKRNTFITAIAYFFILLFLYTAISKLLAFRVTVFDMEGNPLLKNTPTLWAISIPVVEIVVAVLLFLPATRRIGLWASLVLMIGFTAYVGVLLASNFKLPCTCGGIFRELSWWQHLWVDIGLTILAAVALLIQKNDRDWKRSYTKELFAQ